MNSPVLLAICSKYSNEPILLFWIKYDGNPIDAEKFNELGSLMSDGVDQRFWVNPTVQEWKTLSFEKLQLIQFKPGVTDNSAAAVSELLQFHPLLKGRRLQVHSGEIYLLQKEATLRSFNPLIQHSETYETGPGLEQLLALGKMSASLSQKVEVKTISLNGLLPDQLTELSRKNFWALSTDEMLVIQKHFADRPVTDVEIEVIAQTWSEHCKHKIFAANIDYEDDAGKTQIQSLFKTFIQKPTFDLQKKKNWAISVFKDNAGIVRFHENVDLCIKVETHNSPSALDPYGGALTGILGVNRDILGTGLGARPIANTNVLLFGNPDETEALPKGIFHPKEVLKGVHHGIQDGGNKSGIPTINGAMIFDESFSGKPLVFCGTIGVLPRTLHGVSSATKGQRPGDRIVMIGGAVGYDGIHGATSSSLALDESTPSTMVQIGDPLTQKRMSDFLLEARDLGFYNSVTDNGAGGLSSSIGEMATETGGAIVWLDRVPLKYPGLQPWQIFVSESQERMTLSVAPEKESALLELARKRNVQATVVGEFTKSGQLEIFYDHEPVAKLSLEFLHDGLPKMNLRARWSGPRKNQTWKKSSESKASLPGLGEILARLARDPSLASKEKWIRQYDHEVQGATVMKPLEGLATSAPNDSGVIWMGAHGSQDQTGAVVASGLCPDVSEIDPEMMAMMAADEAVRNLVVTGADPEKIALVDNFCWPDPLPGSKNPDAEQKLAELVRTCRGLSRLVQIYEMPLVSGKDSMKNDFIGRTPDGREVKISVLPTLLVTALGYHPDVNHVVKPHAEAGSMLYLVGAPTDGERNDEYFGTSLTRYYGLASTQNWTFDLQKARDFYSRFYQATQKGWIASAHDLSEGGLLFAIFESLMLYRAGIDLNHPEKRLGFWLSENPGRILVSVRPADQVSFERHFEADQWIRLGTVTAKPEMTIIGAGQTARIDLDEIAKIWRSSV